MELGEGAKFSSIVRLPPPRDLRGFSQSGSRLLLQASHVPGFARIWHETINLIYVDLQCLHKHVLRIGAALHVM